MSFKKDGAFEETDKEVILAKKTLETLQVIETAQVILKEKFNGNPDAWMTAVFEALSLKNPAYLMEEMKANDVANSTLNNKFDDSFWNKENRQNVASTGHQLINCFKRFMIGLNRNADFAYLENLVPDLRDAERNIQLYLNSIRQNDASNRSAFEQTNGVREKDAPREPDLSNFMNSIRKGDATRYGVSNKSTFEQTNGVKEKDAARKPDMSQLCPECNTRIVIFNNDIEFSYQLHCQESIHKKAVAKPATKTIEQTTKIFEKRTSEPDLFTQEEQKALRRTLNEKLKKHSGFIRILSRRDFYCDLCHCSISSLQNVESHVDGSKHTNAWKSTDNIFTVDHSGIPFVQLKM